MRIAKLRNIKVILGPVVNQKGYFIFIAPLLEEHYNRYMELILETYSGSRELMDVLTDEDILRETVLQIDTRTDILVDTNLYVLEKEAGKEQQGIELLQFVIDERINYRFLVGKDDLILEFENKPDNELKA